MSLATIIRLEFAYPGVGVLAGDSLQYLSIATAHGVIMVFFMIMPALFGAFGNFLLPTQLGVHDVAFPRLNSAAFWFLPGGLIMLCQLVCVDRRYQRMNCFNIRELQTILKRKFFTDLVNSNDHHDLLANSMVGLRFKTNSLNFIDNDMLMFYNYGTTRDIKVKSNILTNGYYIYLNAVESTADRLYDILLPTFDRLIIGYLLFLNIFADPILYLNPFTSTFSTNRDWSKPEYLNLFEHFEMIFEFFIFLETFYWWRPLITLYNHFFSMFNYISETLIVNFNLILGSALRSPVPSKINLTNTRTATEYTSGNLSTATGYDSKYGTESSIGLRFTRFSNPLISKDYKYGVYLRSWDRLYPSLMTSIEELGSNVRKGPWFFSKDFAALFLARCETFNVRCITQPRLEHFSHWVTLHVQPTDSFFNLFTLISNNKGYLNSRWLSVSSLNQKFCKMFTSSTIQRRTISNWRQLKFTREAWRCKLLTARHQNTLYRRFIPKAGVFWTVERNSKDLLPGWAMITPFSARTRFTTVGRTDIGLMGVFIVLNASIISSANFLVTYRYLSTLNNRKMRDARSFFTESLIVASWMMIAANPMLIIGIMMLLCDRHWQTSFFDYSGGGDTVLFQHMFWFFGHPEVYVIMIPIFGFTNTILSFYLRKRVSARASLMYSMYTIAFLGFFVWGHHMYMVGLSHTTRMLFSTLTVMISVPAATKLMHWCVTLVNSFFTMELPFLWSFTFIFFFVSGGVSGMAVAHTGMDVLFHDTFYVIGHFHVMLSGGGMVGIFGAIYFYFPAIYGVKYSRIYAYMHYVYYIIGQLLTVVPMMWLGYCGMPRRVLDYPSAFGGWHSIASAGHLLSVFAVLSFFFMIYDSIRQAKPTIRNNFGVGRYNTRLNFYLFEVNRLNFLQRKGFYNHRFIKLNNLSTKELNYLTLVNLETTLFSYRFFK
jgi:heme/copper-type cytochrome/quinol oxidase subunit 1